LTISFPGLEEVGLFRISGDNAVMLETKKRIDAGKSIDFSKMKHVHTVAGLIKMYFRELPEPLLTFDNYDMFIAADGNKTI
jgi:hypothetical protein